jgi:hypothetical protein
VGSSSSSETTLSIFRRNTAVAKCTKVGGGEGRRKGTVHARKSIDDVLDCGWGTSSAATEERADLVSKKKAGKEKREGNSVKRGGLGDQEFESHLLQKVVEGVADATLTASAEHPLELKRRGAGGW